MMLRLEYNKSNNPPFESNKIDKYCEEIIKDFNNDNKFNLYLKKVISKIDELKLDLSDTEVSKSSDLVDRIKLLYF